MGKALQAPGTSLRDLLQKAERDVVLVAPFIKVLALRELLRFVSQNVRVTCVTRWRPDEVAAGVSDLEVFGELQERNWGSLLLLPRLHAKYYRADDSCLVGSANLTSRALGFSSPPNVELMVQLGANVRSLELFEDQVISSAYPATAELRDLVAESAAHLKSEPERFAALAQTSVARAFDPSSGLDEEAPSIAADFDDWLPVFRQPQDLFLAYEGRQAELSEAGRSAALADLAALDPPKGLPRAAFDAWMRCSLFQMPLIAFIDRLVIEPQRFGAVRDLIAHEAHLPLGAASTAWQTTMRWLLHFFPDRYERRVPSHSEVFGRVSRDPS